MSERITIKQIPLEELVITPGSACQGCGAALAARLAFKALGPNTIRHSIPACPDNVTRTPTSGGEFEAGGDHVTGTWRALKALGREDVQVVGFYGDGGVYDIGFQSISGAAIRNENVFIICKNNEAYMNTGGQVSGATPQLAMTTTTPVGPMSRGKPNSRKNTPMIFAMHGVPYVATASVAFPTDLIAKIQYGKGIKGFKFLDILSPCPTGWRFEPNKTIEVARLAVQTGFWPLYEIIDGRKFRLTYKPRELKPVAEYLKLQGRFRHLTEEEIKEIQRDITDYWERLLKLDEIGEILL